MILSFCDNPEVLSVFRIIKIVIQIIKIAVPIILIVSGSISFVRAMHNADNNEAIKSFVRKIIAAVLVFLIPTFVFVIAEISSNDMAFKKCLVDATGEGIDKAYASRVDYQIENFKQVMNRENYNAIKNEINKIKGATVKNEQLEKLKQYEIYLEIREAIDKLGKKSKREERQKIQDKINTLSDDDPQKKILQEKLDEKGGVLLGVESGYHEFWHNDMLYYVYFPEDATTDMPLLLWLHGDNPRIEWIKNNKIGPTAAKYDVPVIVVQPYGGYGFGHPGNQGWYEGGKLGEVMEIVNEVCEKYECDKTNINIGGHSRGAIGTWMMVTRYPGVFHSAAPVSCCSFYGIKGESFKGMKVWAVRGSGRGKGSDNDDIYGGCMQSDVNAVKPYTKDLKYTILPNTTHSEATDELQVSEEFVKFMFTP